MGIIRREKCKGGINWSKHMIYVYENVSVCTYVWIFKCVTARGLCEASSTIAVHLIVSDRLSQRTWSSWVGQTVGQQPPGILLCLPPGSNSPTQPPAPRMGALLGIISSASEKKKWLCDPITMYNDYVTIKIIQLELDVVAHLRGRLRRISEFEVSLVM